MKKAFSLLEVIFTIVIIAIIISVAIPKVDNNIQKANILKLKSDISSIRKGIVEYNNRAILANKEEFLETLDNGVFLFEKIINYSIVSSNQPAGWEKISNIKYKAWISSEDFVIFRYNQSNGSFDCNLKEKFCKDLTQ